MNSSSSAHSMLNMKFAELWQLILHFEFDDPAADFTFSDRLARENNWSLLYAQRCMMEYRRFMFLLCVTDESLTPSDQVDQVWHLHLLYTRSYWEDFCENTLHRKIHHGPTKGGKQEKEKYENAYELSKTRYREYFNQEAPADIWPSSEKRFKEINFSRVNLHRYWILPKINWKK